MQCSFTMLGKWAPLLWCLIFLRYLEVSVFQIIFQQKVVCLSVFQPGLIFGMNFLPLSLTCIISQFAFWFHFLSILSIFLTVNYLGGECYVLIKVTQLIAFHLLLNSQEVFHNHCCSSHSPFPTYTPEQWLTATPTPAVFPNHES